MKIVLRPFAGVCAGLLCLSVMLVSCSSVMRAPKKGVTDKFYSDPDSASVDLNRYDFSRLKRGYGLCVFSYRFVGDEGNKISGFHRTTKKGMRVWEYHFLPGDWDVKTVEKRIMFWGYRPLTYLFLAYEGWDVRTHVTFHKGRIVYGGRLLVNFTADSLPELSRVEEHFQEDLSSWLLNHSQVLDSVKIDTALIQVW